jgi:NAD(P)-dependent dehydrogenase (short-subunit alcohol dehydrogenase family)
VVVTGSSTGLGLEMALHLAANDFDVFATIRDEAQRPRLEAAAAERGVTLHVAILDLLDSASIAAGIADVVEQAGGIYALINNGGIGLRGCLEDLDPAEIKRLFDTNVVGTIEVTNAVVPHLRAAGRGRVITITSVGGRISTFGAGAYCASKFAQEGFAEALYLELEPFGLQSIIVEPGMIATERWAENRGNAAGTSDPDSPYHRLFVEGEKIADEFLERSGITAQDVADTVHEALTTDKPRLRYVVGRKANAAIMLRRVLPERAFEKVYFGGFLKNLKKRTGWSRPLIRA